MTAKKSKKKDIKNRGGVLFLISALMFGSAVLRLGFQAGPALSREISQVSEDGESQIHSAEPSGPSQEDLKEILAAFQAREKRLSEREVQLEDRMKAIEIADAALERKITELVQAEEKLRATLALVDGISESDLTQLTNVYQKMKPKETAQIFEKMNPELAAGFLARMKPEAAAGIMAGLSPEVAYSISVVLAGRNSDVPKN